MIFYASVVSVVSGEFIGAAYVEVETEGDVPAAVTKLLPAGLDSVEIMAFGFDDSEDARESIALHGIGRLFDAAEALLDGNPLGELEQSAQDAILASVVDGVEV